MSASPKEMMGLQGPQDHGGDDDAAPLGHAVGFAHQGIEAHGRLAQHPAGQQGPLATHAGEEEAQVFGFSFAVFSGGHGVTYLNLLKAQAGSLRYHVLSSRLTSYRLDARTTGRRRHSRCRRLWSMSIWVPSVPGFRYMAGQPK